MKVPVVFGAVYIPDASMVPPPAEGITDQFTARFAVNCCLALVCTMTLCGVTETAPGGGGGGVLAMPPPAHPEMVNKNASETSNKARLR